TSMAGTWMSVVEGFGGMRVRDGKLSFQPFLPAKWNSFSFHIGFRGTLLNIKVGKEGVQIKNLSGKEVIVLIYGKEQLVKGNNELLVEA
ncbi:MAG TPA: glycosyl hydrolase family 65 protein, partial [Mucilaginibacter sp.]|nr:glycosyl hydrolase family 65 protein [Mucilaginibacter sp.]